MKAKRGVFLLLKKRGAPLGPYNCNSIKKKEYSHLLPRRLKLLLQYHIFTNIQINKHTYIHTHIHTYIHTYIYINIHIETILQKTYLI